MIIFLYLSTMNWRDVSLLRFLVIQMFFFLRYTYIIQTMCFISNLFNELQYNFFFD